MTIIPIFHTFTIHHSQPKQLHDHRMQMAACNDLFRVSQTLWIKKTNEWHFIKEIKHSPLKDCSVTRQVVLTGKHFSQEILKGALLSLPFEPAHKRAIKGDLTLHLHVQQTLICHCACVSAGASLSDLLNRAIKEEMNEAFLWCVRGRRAGQADLDPPSYNGITRQFSALFLVRNWWKTACQAFCHAPQLTTRGSWWFKQGSEFKKSSFK